MQHNTIHYTTLVVLSELSAVYITVNASKWHTEFSPTETKDLQL